LFSAVFGNIRPILSSSLKPWANVRWRFLSMLDYFGSALKLQLRASFLFQASHHNDRARAYSGPTPGVNLTPALTTQPDGRRTVESI
jgi:hypothetical protein